MTISDRVKFMKKSKALFVDGGIAACLDGDASGNNANSMLNHNQSNGWVSRFGGDTNETVVVVDLPSSLKVDRLIFNNHNFKDIKAWILDQSRIGKESEDFAILNEDGDFLLTEAGTTEATSELDRFMLKDDDGGNVLLDQNSGRFILQQKPVYADATLDADPGLQEKVTATGIDVSTSYFSFDSTTAVRVIFKVLETQIADQQKTLKSFIITEELGTFVSYPAITTNFTRNTRAFQMLGNKSRVIKGPIAFGGSLSFSTYPGQADADLINTLLGTDDNFLIWLCGGVSGSSYFRYTIKGFNVDDIYLCQISTDLSMSYTNNVYLSGYNAMLRFVETVK